MMMHATAFKMKMLVVVFEVLFYILNPGLDWVLFPLYTSTAMSIGAIFAIVMQLLPWPSRGSKQLLDALST